MVPFESGAFLGRCLSRILSYYDSVILGYYLSRMVLPDAPFEFRTQLYFRSFVPLSEDMKEAFCVARVRDS